MSTMVSSPAPALPLEVEGGPESGQRHPSSWNVTAPTQAAAGVAASVLGFTVVVAWLIGNDELTRVHPLYPPMPYSVAIGLATSGVALLSGAIGRRRLAGATAGIVLALGLTTIAQYGLALDWNLHRTLLAGLVEGVPPGMAPSSALSFVLIGVGLLAVSVHPRRGGVVCAIAGTAVAAQNAVAFGWSSFGLGSAFVITGSAPHVSTGLAVLGIGTIAAAWDRRVHSFDGPPRWLPLPVALGIALVTWSLWHQSESDRTATIRETTRLRAERIFSELQRQTVPLTDALQRLAAAEAASRSGRATVDPQLLSTLDLQRFPMLHAIAVVDRQSGLRWMQARASVSPSLSDLQVPEQAASVLLRRPLRASPSLVDRSALRAGGSGFLIVAPITDEKDFIGFVVGLFDYDEFFSTTLAGDLTTDYWFRVFGGQRELYRHDGAASNEVYSAAVMIPLFNANWRAEIGPRVVQGPRKPLADWTLVFGLVFAGLLGWTVQLAQRSARNQHLLSDAKADLSSAIIAQQAAQAARDQSEVRYKQIIDAAADIIYRTDVKGRFIFVNPAAIRVTKWSREDLIGRNYLTLIKADRRAETQAFYEAQATHRTPSTYYEFPMMTADDQEVWIGQHVQLLVEGVRVVGFQAVARDISHRVRTQDELQRMRDAALETVRLKSAFVANTSHEIRTPLNGIIGYCNLLLDTELNAEQRACAEGLRVSADALRAIVNDVLDFSKIEAGMLRLEDVSFDLRTVVREVVMVFGEAARRKQLELHVEIADSVPSNVNGDPNRLRQVLNNLLANAIKFTERGAVTVSVDIESPGVLRFSIADTGVGIDPDAQRSLFQPFVQADASTSRRFGGTGLGLAISREIVELMGGSITVASTPGSGSIFTFTVRCNANGSPHQSKANQIQERPDSYTAVLAYVEAGRPVPTDPSSLPQSDGYRVLVVDDNPVSRQVTRLSIEKLGFTVETAGNGLEAVRAASSAPFSLVLMDCQMPVMDGYTAASTIRRAENGTRRTPIIAFTASAHAGERERCLAAGMDDLLEKPFRKEDLVALLGRWAGGAPPPRGVTARTVTPVLVDINVLTDLRSQVGPETLNQMIELHLQEVAEVIQRMERSANGDVASLRRDAHRLKGGSMTLGFSRLGALCSTLEEEADRYTGEQQHEGVRRLRDAWTELRDWQRACHDDPH